MKYLITGHTGFIGKNLVNKVQDYFGISRQSNGINLSFTEGYSYFSDIWRSKLVSTVRSYDPDCIIHLAGNPLVKANELASHIYTTMNLLNSLHRKVRFIYASSATVYGDGRRDIPNEETDIPKPKSIYAAAKLSAEHLIESYARLGYVDGVVLRLCANVGPGATHGVVKAFKKKIASTDQYLEIIGDSPGPLKPFCHVDDTCNAILHLSQIKLTECFNVYNVSPSDYLSLPEVASILGNTKPIKWVGGNWEGDNNIVRLDNTKLKNTGFTFKYPTSAEAVCLS